ncbi:RDD family protein [Streptomyces sp. BE20]|uniref:RDD family protein n=1 Tax=Streptomyces sp. BE20 TaxID=3002525 RepID=UPI002E7A24EE|nr:RDD family protein [Streptomyces sp. BE20]MEE1821601.1 RDD family protein [Streptomyces sp. BE20]
MTDHTLFPAPPPAGPWWHPGAPTGPPPAAPARRTGIPGLASWAQRATAAGVEVGIAGGLMSAYLAALNGLSPAFAALQLLALLADTDIRGALAGGYWVVDGGWLLVQWAERGRSGQGLGGRLVGIVTVDEDTGAPIGAARAIWRGVLHVLDALPAFATCDARRGPTPSVAAWWSGGS